MTYWYMYGIIIFGRVNFFRCFFLHFCYDVFSFCHDANGFWTQTPDNKAIFSPHLSLFWIYFSHLFWVFFLFFSQGFDFFRNFFPSLSRNIFLLFTILVKTLFWRKILFGSHFFPFLIRKFLSQFFRRCVLSSLTLPISPIKLESSFQWNDPFQLKTTLMFRQRSHNKRWTNTAYFSSTNGRDERECIAWFMHWLTHITQYDGISSAFTEGIQKVNMMIPLSSKNRLKKLHLTSATTAQNFRQNHSALITFCFLLKHYITLWY